MKFLIFTFFTLFLAYVNASKYLSYSHKKDGPFEHQIPHVGNIEYYVGLTETEKEQDKDGGALIAEGQTNDFTIITHKHMLKVGESDVLSIAESGAHFKVDSNGIIELSGMKLSDEKKLSLVEGRLVLTSHKEDPSHHYFKLKKSSFRNSDGNYKFWSIVEHKHETGSISEERISGRTTHTEKHDSEGIFDSFKVAIVVVVLVLLLRMGLYSFQF